MGARFSPPTAAATSARSRPWPRRSPPATTTRSSRRSPPSRRLIAEGDAAVRKGTARPLATAPPGCRGTSDRVPPALRRAGRPPPRRHVPPPDGHVRRALRHDDTPPSRSTSRTRAPTSRRASCAHTGHERAAPTIVVGGGWDSKMVENHLGMGAAALRGATTCCCTTDPARATARRRRAAAAPRLGARRDAGGRRRPRPRRRGPRSARVLAVESRRLLRPAGRGLRAPARGDRRRSRVRSTSVASSSGMPAMSVSSRGARKTAELSTESRGSWRHRGRPRADVEDRQAGLLDERRRRPPVLVAEMMRWKLTPDEVAAITLPDAGDLGRARPGVVERRSSTPPSRAPRPDRVHRRRRCRHALRDDQPVASPTGGSSTGRRDALQRYAARKVRA